ncbi:tetratricopeptide repeat protein [Pseudomonas abieticivorans]|uniref:tetratricopeptide repeat protein n=1 Tax=Pseudomonas abieticivorans TaxID=2931382 RepID=UPI0020C0FF38|nr:hypothetical protein [Pseudomonas sp. PIA16]
MSTLTVSDEPALPFIRFAVSSVGEPLPPAKLTLTEQLDGSVKCAVTGDSVSTPAIAKSAAEAAERVTPIDLTLGERLVLVANSIRTRLEAEGYLVQELPSADVKVTAVFDLRTGRLIGRQETLHDFTSVDTKFAERINLSIHGALKKGPLDLATEIHRLIDLGDNLGAAAILEGRSGLGFFGVLPLELLEALQRIDVLVLSAESEKEVRISRMAVAASLNKFDDAEVDAQAILDGGIEDPAESVKFTNTIAFACFKRGEIETAIAMWTELLKSADSFSSSDRAWIWRNLANALPTPGADAIRAAHMSIDSFLEAGDKREAATSILLLSKLLEFDGPVAAVEQLNKMLDVIAANGLMADALRSSIYHSLATQLYNLRSFNPALEAAMQAASLLKGVVGAKRDLIASLSLASILAEKCSDIELSQRLNSEAISLEGDISSEKYALVRQIHALFGEFDSASAEDIRARANESGNSNLIAASEVAIAISDPSLDSTTRLRRLESVVIRLNREKASPEAKYPAMSAIVTVLRRDGKLDRAGIWLRKILAGQPLNLDARDQLLQVLWDSEAWGDAAIFTKEQIALHGNLPGILFAHGKSLLEAGDSSGALSIFMQALKKVEVGNPLRTTILEFRERALELGGVVSVVASNVDVARPIFREELIDAFHEFSNFISGEKRMVFWSRPQPQEDYKWVSHPEKRAQDLFHTFLKARFLHRISVYEELDTGAGRLDIYLKVDGGLSVIVELKMCGFGYPSNYAAAGEGQIQHYMGNRDSHLGYLLVFDARLDKNKEPLIPNMTDSSKTIYEVFVDVRPRVSEKKSKK